MMVSAKVAFRVGSRDQAIDAAICCQAGWDETRMHRIIVAAAQCSQVLSGISRCYFSTSAPRTTVLPSLCERPNTDPRRHCDALRPSHWPLQAGQWSRL